MDQFVVPSILDELRFTAGALKPAEFLTAGFTPAAAGKIAVNPNDPPEEETVVQRRAREALERRKKEKAKRESRRMEEEAKRNRGKP
jgi:hypothetical protein